MLEYVKKLFDGLVGFVLMAIFLLGAFFFFFFSTPPPTNTVSVQFDISQAEWSINSTPN
jgi:hypothetical protein